MAITLKAALPYINEFKRNLQNDLETCGEMSPLEAEMVSERIIDDLMSSFYLIPRAQEELSDLVER